MRDLKTTQRIKELHPLLIPLFTSFIEKAEEKFDVTLRISMCYRSVEEQNKLYFQGRHGNPGPIVSNAPGGYSFHNYHMAIDLCEIKEGGEVEYDMTPLKDLAIEHGIDWGGKWQKIKDKPHFEYRFGFPDDCHLIKSLYDKKQFDKNGFILIPQHEIDLLHAIYERLGLIWPKL